MKQRIKIGIGLLVIFGLLLGLTGLIASAEVTKEIRKIGLFWDETAVEFDTIAKNLASFLAEPEARLFLLEQINASPDSEKILYLKDFVEKALKKFSESEELKKIRAIVTEKDFPKTDLYFPVEEYREQWKGGENLLIVCPLPAYTLDFFRRFAYTLDGERKKFNFFELPETPCLMMILCEHRRDHTSPS